MAIFAKTIYLEAEEETTRSTFPPICTASMEVFSMENIKNDLEDLEINDSLHLCKFCNAAEENRRCSIYPKSTNETTPHCKMFWYSEDTEDGELEYGLASDLNHCNIE